MKRIMLIGFVSLIVLGQPSWTASAQQPQQAQPRIDEFKMITYQAVFLTKGPKWSPETPDLMPMIRAHREYMNGLLASGTAHIAGPFRGDGHLRGVLLLSGTPEQAKAIVEADPGVKAGRYGFEILSWMGPEGWFQKAADIAQTETLYFGFLVTGENTAQISKEETQTLMRGHLDYMNGQAKLGKLVMAGPLVNAAPRRGLIVYRVPTVGEAVSRASGDPMVKAGRMKPEFYEWSVPRGILK
jgi:uncharacterized protein YciI